MTELGVIAGIIFDIRVRTHLGMPSTVWPLAIILVMLVSIPFLLAGTLLARARLKSS